MILAIFSFLVPRWELFREDHDIQNTTTENSLRLFVAFALLFNLCVDTVWILALFLCGIPLEISMHTVLF